MSSLCIFLFGTARVVHDRQHSEVKLTHGVQALLAYLLLWRDRGHSRDVLAGLFWGDHDQEHARRCLNTALWRLRLALEPDGVPRGTYLITTPGGELVFNCRSGYWLDVAAFEAQTNLLLTTPVDQLYEAQAQDSERALQLYTSDLLEGFYQDWALRERERLRQLYLNGLARLLQYYRQHRIYEAGINCGRRILRLDPLREEVHREMMRLYAESGHRPLAAQQYDTCRETLASELGIEPMEETRQLYAEVVSGAGNHPARASYPGELSVFEQTLHHLQFAIQGLEATCEQLRRAARSIEDHVESLHRSDG